MFSLLIQPLILYYIIRLILYLTGKNIKPESNQGLFVCILLTIDIFHIRSKVHLDSIDEYIMIIIMRQSGKWWEGIKLVRDELQKSIDK